MIYYITQRDTKLEWHCRLYSQGLSRPRVYLTQMQRSSGTPNTCVHLLPKRQTIITEKLFGPYDRDSY